MKKQIPTLIVISALLLLIEAFFGEELGLHPSFRTLVIFFTVQTFVLWRIEFLTPEEWKVHVSLVKVAVRLLSSLVFIAILLYTQEERISLTIQFILLYLSYMIFEIVFALTNLRRN